MTSSLPIPVGLLGATGMVGQRFILQLEGHPWFRVAWLGASERSAGRPYAEAARWVQDRPMPEERGRDGGSASRRVGRLPRGGLFGHGRVGGGRDRAGLRACGAFRAVEFAQPPPRRGCPARHPGSEPRPFGADSPPAPGARLVRRDRHQPQLLDHHPDDGPRPAPPLRHPARSGDHAAGGERRGLPGRVRRSTSWATWCRSSGAKRRSCRWRRASCSGS